MFFPVRPNNTPRKSSKHWKQRPKRSSQLSQVRSTTRSSTKDPEPGESTARSLSALSSHSDLPRRPSSMPGVDIDTVGRSGTASFLESRSSLPYPTFSKAHSKEDVRTKPNIPTPDPTDLTEDRDNGEKANGANNGHAENHHAPPSPPLTGLDQPSSRKGTPAEEEEKAPKEKSSEKVKSNKKSTIKIRTSEVNRSSSSLRSKRDDASKSSKTARADSSKSKSAKYDEASPRTSHRSSKSKTSDEKKPRKRSSRSTMSPSRSNLTVQNVGIESHNGSDATSIAPNQQYIPPRKSVTPPVKPPSRNQTRSAASHHHTPSDDSVEYGRHVAPGPAFGAPPPPPPPPQVPVTIPRVDYLLQHGGLENRVSRSLLQGPFASDPFTQSATQPQQAAARVFDPFNRLLDDYSKVMSKNGSMAVATGYRSVARRLLDRLEAVFARDISSEPCSCLMCEREEVEERPEGVSWGEVLELVSGRRELPAWPPFVMAPTAIDTGLGEEHIPMQKLDVDVPEEYREHFIRQSKKTQVAVDKWLSEQNIQASTSAPEEVDDETLTFAMLTHLESWQRSLFCAILGINSSTPVPRSRSAIDGVEPEKPSSLISSSHAIQRLYRLPTLPRDPETAMFMLNHHDLHHVLATLAAISDDEWEILISGRFDGFLRSGAEDAAPPNRWTGSRSNTPFSAGGISRGTTPNYTDGSFRPSSQPNGAPASPAHGGPIALDEETEIAVLAEIERDVFQGMEALEDAFEALHLKAEMVRRALRERGAGLSVANQSRRGSYVEARMGTPFSGVGAWESGTEDDFLDDDRSLAPDDSASNISSNRRRRPKRRTERRTPAPVEEEDEGEESRDTRRDSRNSRRR